MKPAQFCQYICSRNQYDKLTHDGYDHTEHSLSKCLEYSTTDDAKPCKQVVDTDDTKRLNANCKHISRSIEHSEKYLRNEFKAKESEEHNAKCSYHTELDCFDHTLSVLRTVVECNDRSDTVIQTEDRHEEKALQFEIHSEYGSCSR